MPYGIKTDYYSPQLKRRFRLKSKHELMWASWMDRQGITWDYEPVKFEDPDKGSYTPDFGLHENTLFLEIKTYGNQVVKNKIELCLHPLILIFGHPLKCDLYVQFPENIFKTHRFTDWTSAYNLARNGLPSWLRS